ncbi:uncharacterized protein FOMMEDRAFT_114364 [Fomitiporia mediterranea MF3/22]|uniref:uncharacterized protein n=1 Tax=Fomitiporia mediterranea (strain MF3/22) TaxID=694068 RepID=UPI0004407E38|nr:uncharacterized protein FOMMEDRAFT_114364 [Fomitiporia mediterranea MF3/22]EJC98532.1 hypothetical protein FOMMEDRAFT_114364 [Fomitiporia mediterranea MF3/22]
MSTRELLSLPTTTTHFRRFAAKSGPIWWLQDRIEEILMWKKGWKVTTAWMMTYAFICYFPRLVLLIPHAILLTILLSAYSYRKPSTSRQMDAPSNPPYTQPAEGSPEWFSNLQAIQNLMGVVADTHDMILFVFVPHLTFSTPYSYSILAFTALTALSLLLVLPLIPLRPLFLVLGLLPFVIAHPFTLTYLPVLLAPHMKRIRMRLARFVDDDRLEDHHLKSVLREVELWENERLGPGPGGSPVFGKNHLKPHERKGWTRGRDGWDSSGPDGSGDVRFVMSYDFRHCLFGSFMSFPPLVPYWGSSTLFKLLTVYSSNLTFTLEVGWAFVETEDWRKDLEASWTAVESDDDGWVYTNDAWMDPQSAPLDSWKSTGVTRRRRWIRRIYQTK